MKKRTRLRVGQEKKGRRVFWYVLLCTVFFFLCYQLEKHYKILDNTPEWLPFGKGEMGLVARPPSRGILYDRKLMQLAVTKQQVSVFIRTRELDSAVRTAETLAKTLKLDQEKLQKQLESGVLRVWAARGISHEQEQELRRIALPGVHFQEEEKRVYPNQYQAAHLLGYVQDGIGLSGVEYYYDRLLVNRQHGSDETVAPLKAGFDLVLTIDLKIQTILESLVQQICIQEDANRTAVYLLESGSGEIIGGAQYPGFNPNDFTAYTRSEMENVFFSQILLPDKFRLFLRDCADLFIGRDADQQPKAWSLLNRDNTLGAHLRLWEQLGLSEETGGDYHVSAGNAAERRRGEQRVRPSGHDFGLMPEWTTPMGLLNGLTVLAGNGRRKKNFVVKKFLEQGSGTAINLIPVRQGPETSEELLLASYRGEVERFFKSQASRGDSGAYFFRDEILLQVRGGGHHKFKVNDLVFVLLPAGEDNLTLLLVVEKDFLGVDRYNRKRQDLEQILDEKLIRLANLHMVAKSSEDIFEPQVNANENFLPKEDEEQIGKQPVVMETAVAKTPRVMPDLFGLSLRKSLRLLQGVEIAIHIQGTGRVMRQQPAAGESLKDISQCYLYLEIQENMNFEKLSHDYLPQQ